MNIITNKDKSDAARCIEAQWARHELTTRQWLELGQFISETPVGATCLPTMRALPAAPEPLAIESPRTPVGPYERVVLERVSLERGAR